MLEAKDTKNIRGQGEGQPYRGQTLSRPTTGMLKAKAKDQGHKAEVISKKKKEKVYTLQKCVNFPENLGVLQEKKNFKKFIAGSRAFSKTKQNCHDLGPFSIRQKIVLSSIRGQGIFEDLQASRSRPRT